MPGSQWLGPAAAPTDMPRVARVRLTAETRSATGTLQMATILLVLEESSVVECGVYNDAPVPLKFAPDTPVLLSFFARANQNCGSGIRYVFSLWASPWVTRTRGCPRPDVSRIRLPPIASSAPRSFAWLTCCPPSGAPGRRSPRQHHAPPLPSSRRARGAAVTPPPAPARVERRLAAAAAVVVFRAREASSRGSREARARLAHVFPSGTGDDRIDPGSTVYTVPPGRIGAIGDPHARDLAFERWVLEPPPADDGLDLPAPAPEVGPLKLRAVWGRGRGLVTTRPVEAGETLMRVPLMKCLSTASARRGAIAPALAEISSPRVTAGRSSRSISSTSCTSRARHRRGGRTSASFPRTWARP